MTPRVLLTSVVRPFGGAGEGDSVGAELFHAQVTRAQGAFSLRQVIRVWGLDLIAENIDAPTVVLHYPSLDELEEELARTRPTHVGINFVVATFHKIPPMVERIRKIVPEARIILGGYGTVLPDRILLPYCDDVCREEGVNFMRRLLGETLDRPIVPAYSPVPASRVLGYQQSTIVGHVTAGLGCANGCDFCCTSHFFKRRYVRLRGSGSDIYDAMMETKRRAEAEGHRMSSFALIDEDFFLQKKRAEDFLEAVRRGGEPLSIFGFGSVKGLSQFTAAEIAEMGFDLIWTAFEGKSSGYEKLKGRPIGELHDDLKDHGVGTLCSMIVGFDYQTEATVRAEFEELMELEPALVQILIYFAFPGTPLFEEVVRESKFLPRYAKNADLRRWDGFALHLEHPHFTSESLEALQRELYRKDFERLGPSVHRLAKTWLRGVRNLDRSTNPLLRKRAERLRRDARSVMPTFAARALLPSAEAKRRADALERELVAMTGKKTIGERLMGPFALGLGAFAEASARLGILQQPSLLRITHRIVEDVEHGSPLALHGEGASLLSRLGEDLRRIFLEEPLSPPAIGAWEAIDDRRGSVVGTRPLRVVPSCAAE